MEKLKHSKIGIISFLLAFIPIIYVIIQTIMDLAEPINTGFNKSHAISYIIMNFMFAISFVSLVLGIIAITKKGYNKKLPICALIMSGLILLVPFLGSIINIINILNM